MCWDMFGDWARDLTGSTIPASAEHLHFTLREPYGVVARIIPFNHPIFFAAAKVAAPIVAGNAVVLKPAEISPLSALRMAELVAEVLSAGVLSVVVGDGPEVGRALVRHPAIRRIGFIGSEPTGRAIQRDAAESGGQGCVAGIGRQERDDTSAVRWATARRRAPRRWFATRTWCWRWAAGSPSSPPSGTAW
jgi:acyl-CoA reductase-like NAD-dependent aldehyde dehydrogenase